MGKLPIVSGARTVRVFESLGWVKARQSGSHVILTKEGSISTLSVPLHSTLAKGTLRTLIQASGISVDQFVGAERRA